KILRKWFPRSISLLEGQLPSHQLHEILNGYLSEGGWDLEGPSPARRRGEGSRFLNYMRILIRRKDLALTYLTDVLEFEGIILSIQQEDAGPHGIAEGAISQPMVESLHTEGFQKRVRPLLANCARIVSFPYDMAKLIPALETRQP